MDLGEVGRWFVEVESGGRGDDDGGVVPGDGGVVEWKWNHATFAADGVFAGADEAVGLLFLF